MNGSIVTTNYPSRSSEVAPQKTDTTFSWSDGEETKHVRPYFLIKPQTVLMLPNETGRKPIEPLLHDSFTEDDDLAKFKCCFGGDPFPSIIWTHKDTRITDTLAQPSRYRTHKLHDIHYLDVAALTIPDNGQVKCTIMNKFGQEDVLVQLLVVRKSFTRARRERDYASLFCSKRHRPRRCLASPSRSTMSPSRREIR